jgi:cytochrome P450
MTDSEWVLSETADVHAVLADDRFGVRAAEPGAPAGTVAWLRASVSRFANGPEHDRRRALVVAELGRLDPAGLRTAARDRTAAELTGLGGAQRADDGGLDAYVVGRLARQVPAAVLAARFGAADPDQVAAAVGAVAAAYFPGAGEPAERAADAATASLLDLLAGTGQDEAVARITVLVQGYDATANLVAAALSLLPGLPADVPTDRLLDETAYRRPPVPALRRVAAGPAQLGERAIAAGDSVVCEVRPLAAPAGPAAAALTFGYGLRPCPGPAQALALAAGVIDAFRQAGSGR